MARYSCALFGVCGGLRNHGLVEALTGRALTTGSGGVAGQCRVGLEGRAKSGRFVGGKGAPRGQPQLARAARRLAGVTESESELLTGGWSPREHSPQGGIWPKLGCAYSTLKKLGFGASFEDGAPITFMALDALKEAAKWARASSAARS
jgi:hypothetical protein